MTDEERLTPDSRRGPFYARHDDGRLRAYIRYNPESEATAVTVWGPKTADHPTRDWPCPACLEPMREGQYTVLVPLGPGKNPEARLLTRLGKWFNAAALEAHFSCISGVEDEDFARLQSEAGGGIFVFDPNEMADANSELELRTIVESVLDRVIPDDIPVRKLSLQEQDDDR